MLWEDELLFYRMVRKGLSEKVAFEKRPPGNEDNFHADNCGKSVTAEEIASCKGPVVRVHLVCSRNKQARVDGWVERMRSREDHVEKDFSFCRNQVESQWKILNRQ